jgi:hypothetical protein
MGGFRKELLIQLIKRFGRNSFSYKEASTVPGFFRAAFMTLYADGLIKKASKGMPLRYGITSAPIRSKKEQDVVPRMAQSETTILVIFPERGCLCSGGQSEYRSCFG